MTALSGGDSLPEAASSIAPKPRSSYRGAAVADGRAHRGVSPWSYSDGSEDKTG